MEDYANRQSQPSVSKKTALWQCSHNLPRGSAVNNIFKIVNIHLAKYDGIHVLAKCEGYIDIYICVCV